MKLIHVFCLGALALAKGEACAGDKVALPEGFAKGVLQRARSQRAKTSRPS